MKKQKPWGTLIITLITLAALLIAFTTATYAWFQFDPYTNVTPMEGRISEGETILLISESQEGPFERRCTLNPSEMAEELKPVSTGNLTQFYTATTQDREGYSIAFRDVTASVDEWLIHGTVYLQCIGEGCDVYLQQPALDLGDDPQVLAAGRLGLRITGISGASETFLFRLDSLGSTAGVPQRQTVRAENAVVGGITAGAPQFEQDPSSLIGEYLLGSEGAKPLYTMQPSEIAAVEYWLYLEGCDPECSNPVQSRDVILQLGFAGNPIAN